MNRKEKENSLVMRFCFILLLTMTFLVSTSGISLAEDKPSWKQHKPWMEWGEAYWPTKPVRGGYFRTASSAYVGNMNPNHWPINDWGIIMHYYEGLTATDAKFRQRNAWLLDRWEFTDPLTVVMVLKKGITFHDGAVFNAKGLKYQYDWMKDKKNGCWTRSMLDRFKSVEVVDEYTLKWTTYKPWGSFPVGFFGFVISPKALEKDYALKETEKLKKRVQLRKKKLAKYEKKAAKLAATGGAKHKNAESKVNKTRKIIVELEAKYKKAAVMSKGHISTDLMPVGTGRYILEEARPGNYIKSKRNPNWWFGQSIGHPDMPYFDGRIVMIIPDPATRLANLRAGKIDALGIEKSFHRLIKDDPKYKVFVNPINFTIGLNFNQKSKAIGDIRVRKAISHAIDRRALIHGTQFGLGRNASCVFPGDHWAHNPALKPVSHDPKLSKKLLAEAGYANGLSIKGYTLNDAGSQAMSVAVKAMLAKVGVEWKVQALELAAWTDKYRNLDYDLNHIIYPFIEDPDLTLNYSFHPTGAFNFGRNHNVPVIRLIEAGRTELDFEKRTAIYHEMEKLLYENYEDIWLWWGTQVTAYQNKVMGYNHEMRKKFGQLYEWSHPLWFKDGRP